MARYPRWLGVNGHGYGHHDALHEALCGFCQLLYHDIGSRQRLWLYEVCLRYGLVLGGILEYYCSVANAILSSTVRGSFS